jgi:hypothetical protein
MKNQRRLTLTLLYSNKSRSQSELASTEDQSIDSIEISCSSLLFRQYINAPLALFMAISSSAIGVPLIWRLLVLVLALCLLAPPYCSARRLLEPTSHFRFTGKLGEDYPGKIRLRLGIPDYSGRASMRDLDASCGKAQIAVCSLFKAYPLLRCCHPSDGKTYRLLRSSASS